MSFLDEAVKAYNETPHSTLHGETPADVLHSPEATFMLMQDNARKMQHNANLLRDRKADCRRRARSEPRGPRP